MSEPMLKRIVVLEPPLPPPEPPVIINDLDFTQERTQDRENLAKCVQSLAFRVKKALDDDRNLELRYARRLRLDNLVDDYNREEFVVRLPVDASCWNTLDIDSIELEMLSSLVRQVPDDQHSWFKVRALFDDFMDQVTKDFMDKLDRGESLDLQSASNLEHSQPSPAPAMTTTTTMAASCPPCSSEVITISDDDEDVITLD